MSSPNQKRGSRKNNQRPGSTDQRPNQGNKRSGSTAGKAKKGEKVNRHERKSGAQHRPNQDEQPNTRRNPRSSNGSRRRTPAVQRVRVQSKTPLHDNWRPLATRPSRIPVVEGFEATHVVTGIRTSLAVSKNTKGVYTYSENTSRLLISEVGKSGKSTPFWITPDNIYVVTRKGTAKAKPNQANIIMPEDVLQLSNNQYVMTQPTRHQAAIGENELKHKAYVVKQHSDGNYHVYVPQTRTTYSVSPGFISTYTAFIPRFISGTLISGTPSTINTRIENAVVLQLEAASYIADTDQKEVRNAMSDYDTLKLLDWGESADKQESEM